MPKFTAIILVDLFEDTREKALEVAKSQVLLMEENAQTNGFARVHGVYEKSCGHARVCLDVQETTQERDERQAAYWKWYDEVNV